MGVIFFNTLRQNWRAVLQWGGGLAGLGLFLLLAITDMDTIDSYAQLLETMPPEMMAMFGVSSADMITTPDGFIAFGFFSYALILLGVYAVGVGLDITASEEEDGILDVVLSLPVPRWQVITERFAAYVVLTTLIAVVSFTGILIGSATSDLELNLGRLFIGTLNVIPGTLVMIALTAFLAVVFRRKGTALGIAAGIIVASYFMDFLAEQVSSDLLDSLKAFSLFTYYDSQGVVRDGLIMGDVFVLLTACAVLIAGSLWAFERRDVGL